MITINSIKNSKENLVMTTAYDATMAKLVDGIVDIILVGDSLGMVVQGHTTTIPVNLVHSMYHTECVSRVVKKSHVVGDLPFMSYQISPEQALKSAGKLMKSGAHAVKLEGGVAVADHIYKIVSAGIPVMGHIGLTPQSVHAFGGFKVQGKTDKSIKKLTADLRAVRDAGAYSVVLECIPPDVAQVFTKTISRIPTIGIGAGPHCNGQVLVSTDLIGMTPDFNPKFVKKYGDVAREIRRSMLEFVSEVRSGEFPDKEHSF